MRFDTQVIYPHPVLRPDVADYNDGDFQVVLEFAVSENQEDLEINATYDLSVKELSDLIEKGEAGVGLLINCRDTFYREVHPIATGCVNKIEIKGGILHGEIIVVPIIYAVSQIADFTSPDFAQDFSGMNFNMEPGDFLAHENPEIIYLEREAFEPVESIIILTTDLDREGYEWEINLEEDQIQIVVSKELSDSIQNARNSQRHIVVLINSLYFAAIQAAVTFLATEEEETDLKWANVIRQKCNSKGISDLKPENAHMISQSLLEYPIESLAKLVFGEGE